MRIYFQKKRSRYHAYEYMVMNMNNHRKNDGRYYLFSPTEVEKIRQHLGMHIRDFDEVIKDNNEYRYYSVKFYNKEDTNFFLLLTANGIEI